MTTDYELEYVNQWEVKRILVCSVNFTTESWRSMGQYLLLKDQYIKAIRSIGDVLKYYDFDN